MQDRVSFTKSGLVAAFFLLYLQLASATATTRPELNSLNVSERLNEAAKTGKLYQLPVWSALLHAGNGHSNIADAKFLLSLPDFSPERELQLTIDFLYRGGSGSVCRFPARYLWLRRYMDAPELPLDACPDIIEFRQKVPIDEVSLVFASERIAQPASMLGHAFLKFSGKNVQGQEVSHAISFYTDANTLNLPKLLFDSLIIGKNGYFSLSPYYEQQQRYVDEEQRNLWEYKLTLDKFQKELIRLHILELKQSNLTYFFQKYNCATVLNFIIALSGKPMSESGWWVTPKDLLKNAQQAGLIGDTHVITPSRWLYRALVDQVPSEEQQSIRHQIDQGNVEDNFDLSGSEQAFIRLELARVYNQYAYLDGVLNRERWIVNEITLADDKAQFFPDMSLSSEDRFNPLNSPGDSQISISTQHDAGGAALALTVLPISHTLSDDNRSYSSETSLQLFATTIKLPLNHGGPELDRLTIFDMLSLVPYDEVTGGSSTHFHIAYEPQKNSELEIGRVFATSGAVGLTKRLINDIDIYSLVGGGVGYTGVRGYFYTTLEAGAILREVWDMKSIFSLARTDNQVDIGSHYYTVGISQSKFIDNTKTLLFELKCDFNNDNVQNTIAITLKNIF